MAVPEKYTSTPPMCRPDMLPIRDIGIGQVIGPTIGGVCMGDQSENYFTLHTYPQAM